MKQIIIVALFGLFMCACSGLQEPVFETMDHLSIQVVSTNKIAVSGEAVCQNPNPVGGKLVATNIEVFANDVNVGMVDLRSEIDVPANSAFRLPLSFNTSPKEIFKNNKGGLLGGVLNALTEKSVAVKYQGTATVKFAGVSFAVPIDYEEEVKIGK